MISFHIYPKHPLAVEAASRMRRLLALRPNIALVAIRGVELDNGRVVFEDVYPAPFGTRVELVQQGYLWTYVSPQEWLRKVVAHTGKTPRGFARAMRRLQQRQQRQQQA